MEIFINIIKYCRDTSNTKIIYTTFILDMEGHTVNDLTVTAREEERFVVV